MNVVNPLRHPQTLFAGFAASDPRLERMGLMVGESRRLEAARDLTTIRHADWDLLVVEGDGSGSRGFQTEQTNWVSHVGDHMFVLSFNAYRLGSAISGFNDGASATVWHGGQQYSHTLRLPEQLEGRLARLVRAELVPAVMEMPQVPYLEVHDGALEGYASTFATPFLLDADGHHVASSFRRSHDNMSVCWALPHISDYPELWLAAALEQWANRDPNRFPAASPWRARTKWMTMAESEVAQASQDLEAAHAEQEVRYHEEQRELETDAAIARSDAESGARRLLTMQSDPLVVAVREALQHLGFSVEDVDEGRDRESLAKVEDLQVMSPDHPGLVVIAEVKGLPGGARQADIQQLGRHAAKFAVRNHKLPDRQWYVVNQFRADDPDTRETPLKSAPEAVRLFAIDGGLVIDTRCLFSLLRDVEGGALEKDEARALLMNSTGVLVHGIA